MKKCTNRYKLVFNINVYTTFKMEESTTYKNIRSYKNTKTVIRNRNKTQYQFNEFYSNEWNPERKFETNYSDLVTNEIPINKGWWLCFTKPHDRSYGTLSKGLVDHPFLWWGLKYINDPWQRRLGKSNTEPETVKSMCYTWVIMSQLLSSPSVTSV